MCFLVGTQLEDKVRETGDSAAVNAKDVARQIAEKVEPKADELTRKIEDKAADISANAEPYSHDVADEYQKAAKVKACYHLDVNGMEVSDARSLRC